MTRRLLAVLLSVLPALAAGQGVRVSGVSSAQLVELRPLVVDSAGVERSGALVNAAPFLQDFTLAAWGLAQGLSFHANARVRTQLASDGLVYPGANDRFDLLDAYAELERSWGRARLGRQWVMGGLGAYDFDGASLVLRRGRLSAEGWGGRALAAGLFESHTSAELAAVESRPPDQDGYVAGGRVRLRPGPRSTMTLQYQRVLVADRSGLYSERAAFDASHQANGAVVDLALAYDFAGAAWNEVRARLGTAKLSGVGYSVEVRHSRPFFELWTIWGAFAPVGFDEARATVDWRPRATAVSFGLHGGYRRYGESNAGLDLRTNGWRAGADASWFGEGALSLSGSYDVDIGFGASRSDGRARVRWTSPSGATIGVEGSALQNIYEFRLGTGRVFGAAVDGAVSLSSDVRFVCDAGVYRHARSNGALGPDWTQRRASARLEWTLGRDPGVVRGKAP
ncbi:MAG TPA: hypothetical protein VJL28_02270 [Gemmatimonadaceae bacterium]|nr:hypothetical protein [Gemmatimonadaceae bacterium]